MEIPYGFDCYAFQREEIKYFEPNLYKVRHSVEPSRTPPSSSSSSSSSSSPPQPATGSQMAPQPITTFGQADFIKFTRKNEDYPSEQIQALGRANRLNMSEIDKRLFCGIKIQIGIGVVTNFLRKGLQYKPPIRGRSELVNGTWTGVMKGLTIGNNEPSSYDLALGNFLAWDEEFPFIKFGPFFAVESKLVFLTGGSRSIETSSFGTNMRREIWLTILSLLLILSLLASFRIFGSRTLGVSLKQLVLLGQSSDRSCGPHSQPNGPLQVDEEAGVLSVFSNFLFIYTTMLLNKPSVEFDDLVWPKKHRAFETRARQQRRPRRPRHHWTGAHTFKRSGRASKLPTSIRALSYMWSAACLVIASIYSGEMLAVMLLHADQNIDTIAQLINARPQIEPVIRQDDMTYNLMLKSLDENMLRLHNVTRIIPRAEVYTRSFIESVSERKVALLGDDELIDTIYDLYHKYYPLYKSKISYLQYPISIIYRKDLNASLEVQLRRGMVQMFEMGLIHRWYQAQKDTYIQFYDTYERNKTTIAESKPRDGARGSNSEHKYKPLSIHHFSSFFRATLYIQLLALFILILEMAHHKLVDKESGGENKKRAARVGRA